MLRVKLTKSTKIEKDYNTNNLDKTRHMKLPTNAMTTRMEKKYLNTI